jgi:membrane-bound ClpP family serine protease
MVAATRDSPRRALWGVALFVLAVLLHPLPAWGQGQPVEDGLFITVHNPITSDVVNRVRSLTEHALARKDRLIRTVVYDFNPQGRPSNTKEYGPCRDLAAYLQRLQQVQTVAFVHNEVTGHTVLPVLACKDIVMSREAKLGDGVRGQTEPLQADQVKFYEELARGRKGPPVIVQKMIDKNLEVVQGTLIGGNTTWYIDKRDQAKEAGRVLVQPGKAPILVAGNVGLYTAAEAQHFDLCRLIRETRADVAEAYQLSVVSMREDPLEGRDPKAVRVRVKERINKAYVETLKRVISKKIGEHVNMVIVELDCGPGNTQDGRDFAEFLRDLKDNNHELPVFTVAYIPKEARDAATFVALGCTEIVMGPNAEIGDFTSVVKPDARPETYRMLEESLVGLAQEQHYRPVLVRAMLDRSLTVYRVQSLKGQAEWRLMSEEELAAENAANPNKWGNKTLIKAPGQNLTAQQAKDAGLIRDIADNYEELVHRVYGLKQVRDADYDFLYYLAEFLRSPVVGVFLIMIGIACLILEMKMPGVGLPAIIAALCFILYFWAHSQLSGQITILAILLFVLGLILLALEVFVLPGFGVTGICGILLVIVSLGLATLDKKPETTYEWMQFGQSLGTVVLAVLGALTLAFLIAWYLPTIPYANRLILKPPTEVEDGPEGGAAPPVESEVPLAALLGAIGVAATTLRPAGIARFGEDFVDVLTEGGFIEAGSRVQVIEIEGNRVVVKEV